MIPQLVRSTFGEDKTRREIGPPAFQQVGSGNPPSTAKPNFDTNEASVAQRSHSGNTPILVVFSVVSAVASLALNIQQ